jgi:phage protein D
VLATINTVDFLYTCTGHLADRGFATSLGVNETQQVKLTEGEISRIKEEWEERQRKKEEKEKERKKNKEKTETDSTKDKEGDTKSPKVPGSLSASPTPTPTHERYALHRDYFAS